MLLQAGRPSATEIGPQPDPWIRIIAATGNFIKSVSSLVAIIVAFLATVKIVSSKLSS